MKATQYFIPTQKEDPVDTVAISHKLMIRAGLVKKLSSGLYSYLPMGLRVLHKIEKIIREEMNQTNALEFLLPVLVPSGLWKQSKRWDLIGKELFRFSDRHNADHLLGPTHEESFSFLLKPFLKSYKDLPLNVYQIQTKFRDEIRPRFGVIRSREFIMKDAYSFHMDDESLDVTYQTMRQTYRKIFQRCGLKTIPVEADSGSMGGGSSEEFMVFSSIGEETVLICKKCDYKSNQEKTPLITKSETHFSVLKKEKVFTPDTKTIEDVANFFQVGKDWTIKAVLLKSQKLFLTVFIQGDRELNFTKLKTLLELNEVEPMTQQEILDLGLFPGFVGPKLESNQLQIYYDKSLNFSKPYVAAINEKDYHMKGYILEKEIGKKQLFDLSQASDGDPCPSCFSFLMSKKSIEIGHIFKLGKKYTQSFQIEVSNQKGNLQTPIMGCYGIGLNRTMATIMEQYHDETGIFFPISIAPFEIILISITKKPEQKQKVQEIYEYLKQKGFGSFLG